MYRAAIVAIALTLAASPGTTLLCRIWCDLDAVSLTAAVSCHQNAGSTAAARLAENETCQRLNSGAALFVGESTQRLAQAPAHHHAVPVHRYLLALSAEDDRRPTDATDERCVERRRLCTVLRL
jgi:hypothetical protein